MDKICKCGCRPDPIWETIFKTEKELRACGIKDPERYIRYPDPLWGIGTLERNSEHRDAQDELNRLRAESLRQTGIASVQPIIDRLAELDIRYPEEVKMDGIEAQLRREMAKGRVYGHFA